MSPLFAFFGLWETTLLAAAGAVSVPVIIHLLNRRRFVVVTWAAMRFLLAAQRQNTRRMRLEQILLLLTRAALVLLLVLAMASIMPWAENVWGYFWPDGAGMVKNRTTRIHHVVVLDGSLSMNLASEGATCFEKARQLALKKIKDANPGDGFSVLLMKENPVWIVGETSQDARKVARELEEIHATHGNASVPATLGMVAAKLGDNANRFPTQAVYFFTDMQRATWANVPPLETNPDGKDRNVLAEISQRSQLAFIDVGREGVGNLAVTDVGIEVPFITTGMEVPVTASVQNYSPDLKKNVRIELRVGRARDAANDPTLSLRTVSQELKDVSAGERVTVAFTHRFTSAGTYAVQVKIENDELDVDDVRTVVITVKETIPVLLVNGKPSPDRFDTATEYLRIALNPFAKGTEPKYAPLRPRVVSVPQFGDMPENELLAFDCIFFCDVGQFGVADMRRLETFVWLGGGLIFATGEQVAENLETYNRLLFKNGQGLLPAKLVQKAQDQFTLHAPEDGFRTPPLKAFEDERDRFGLLAARFRQYLVAEPVNDPKLRTILSYLREELIKDKEETRFVPTNHPSLLEWNPPLPRIEAEGSRPRETRKGPLTPLRYRGKSIVLTSTANMDWNSWPGSPSYGAMMQELVRLGVSGKLRENALLVGQPLEEFFASGGLDLDVFIATPEPRDQARVKAQAEGNVEAIKLLGPARKVKTQSQGPVSIFRWTETDLSGIYAVTAKGEVREHIFAVNFPSSTADQRDPESDLSRLPPERMKELYSGWDFQIVTDPRGVRIEPGQGAETDIVETRGQMGPSVAHVLLLAVLVLLFVEVVLAWQFGHYTTVDGASSPPATGLFWPVFVACVVGVLFAVLALVLGHAYRTGDFLGFLPDAMRGRLETALGVPPAAAGEGTRWDLEFKPFFRDAASDPMLAGLLVLGAIGLLIVVYRSEGPLVRIPYKVLLAGMRLFLILFTLAVLLPQLELRFDRQGWPDVVLLIDDSRSMGEPDHFQDDQVRDRAKSLGEHVRNLVKEKLPAKVQALEQELGLKKIKLGDDDNPTLQLEVEQLTVRLQTWQNQLTQANSPAWRPTRLQLIQALLAQPDLDWLEYLVQKRRTKVHLYHLDAAGRAIKLTDTDGGASEITDGADFQQLQRAQAALAGLEAEGKESRLGTALRQVIDQYRGASLSAVIMFTDGVTTRDETIAQVGDYAATKGIPLFFVGVGDDHEIRDLRLHDLQVEDAVYVNDRVVFEARVTGHGYKDLKVPVVLKVKDKDGKEKELAREQVKIDEHGKWVKVRLRHQPTEVGRKLFIIEVEAPKSDRPDKTPPPNNLRLERTIDVMDTKLIKVLLVEGSARYEYRFLKSLLERETPDDKKNRSVDLRVVLLDADADFAAQDKVALADFPATREELEQYDVIILGDVDPKHPKLGEQRLRNLADFVRGEDSKGRKTGKSGGGMLFVAGSNHNPHSYRNTPLADVLPIEPLPKPPVEPEERPERYRFDLTPVGKLHPIFRFSSDDTENQAIWHKLQQLHWWSSGFRIKPLAEVLAVHPTQKALVEERGQDPRHPLVVQQFVGSGRTMFFGFDETWRWRFREDEVRFNKFWIQTVRYLSRGRLTRTDLRLDRQTPYRLGEPIKVTVTFPDTAPAPGEPKGPPIEVKVIAEFRPNSKDAPAEPEIQTLSLAKIEGSRANFEGFLTRTREGKYRFWLSTPDVSKTQPGGEKPNAEASVELPPGELEKLRLNQPELTQAAEATQGGFYNLAAADKLLEELPSGFRVSLSTPRPPLVLWNHWLCFLLVLGLITAEWLLRKRKHLL